MWFTTSDARSVTACGPRIMPSDPAAPRCLTGVAARGRCLTSLVSRRAFSPGSDKVASLRPAAHDRPSAACWHTSCSSCNNPKTSGERRANNTTQRAAINFSWRTAPRSLPVNMSWQRVMEASGLALSRLASRLCSSLKWIPMALILHWKVTGS